MVRLHSSVCGFRVAGVSLAELREVVFSMKRSGACRADGVCIRVLLLSFDAIGPFLIPAPRCQHLSLLM